MDWTVETHYYGDDLRIVVDYDRDASNPREDDPDYVGMFPLKLYPFYKQFTPGKTDATWLYLTQAADRFGIDSDEFVDEVENYFGILGISFKIHEFMDQRTPVGKYIVYGYEPETTRFAIDQYVAQLDSWLCGEVYLLTKQTKHKYVSATSPLVKFVEVWEDDMDGDEVCQIGGVYLENPGNADDVADFFDGMWPVDMEVDLFVD